MANGPSELCIRCRAHVRCRRARRQALRRPLRLAIVPCEPCAERRRPSTMRQRFVRIWTISRRRRFDDRARIALDLANDPARLRSPVKGASSPKPRRSRRIGRKGTRSPYGKSVTITPAELEATFVDQPAPTLLASSRQPESPSIPGRFIFVLVQVSYHL